MLSIHLFIYFFWPHISTYQVKDAAIGAGMSLLFLDVV